MSSRRTERDALTSLDLIWRQDVTLSQSTYRDERKDASNLSLCRKIAVTIMEPLRTSRRPLVSIAVTMHGARGPAEDR